MTRKNLLGRRALIAACVAAPAVAVTGGVASADPIGSALPAGKRRGAVVDTDSDGTEIYEVLDSEGTVVGYTLADEKLREMSVASSALAKEDSLDGSLQVQAQAAGGITSIAACAAAIAGFVALTVFPAARMAKLAWRLGKLTAKYGPKLVARIFGGARGIAGRTVERELIDLAKELSGVAALAACGI
ncbi:hypothetical protein [Brachybacterium phenoliresistens]|uniref:hypothetical protein n=1 Tax=Brachybacterium phenoliresistens TaxID=396014 RepID=UPI0031D08FA1